MAEKKEAAEERITAVTIGEGAKRVKITCSDVRDYLCPNASLPEIGLFLATCKSQGLNPFAKEVYLVKMDDRSAASIIVSIDAYLKAAEKDDQYNGHEAGIILAGVGDQPLEFRQGEFLTAEERKLLIGGWAKVYRKDREKPFYAAVALDGYRRYKRDGQPTEFWSERKCATMIRKTALKRALFEAFPSHFSGNVVTEAEFEEVPEGTIQPTFEKNGEIDWAKFHGRMKDELGLSPDEGRALLGVAHLHDLLAQGKTVDDIWLMLVQKRQETGKDKAEIPTQPDIPLDDKLITGWNILKGKVQALNIQDWQLTNWCAHYNVKLTLFDLCQPLPPQGITNELISKLTDALDSYSDKMKRKARG